MSTAVREAYERLLEEMLRLTQDDPGQRARWLRELFERPLEFPAALAGLERFTDVGERFAKMLRGAGNDGALEQWARKRIERRADVERSIAPARTRSMPGLLGDEPSSGSEPHYEAAADTVAEPESAPPPAPAAAPANGGGAPPFPQPPPPSEQRFLNAAIRDHESTQPLEIATSYLLEFGVGLTAVGDGSTRVPDAAVLYGPGEELIELTVTLTSDDFDIDQDAAPLKLPRTGPSKNKARFEITPKKEGRCRLTASIHKQGNFLLQMVLEYSVGDASGAKGASTETHGRSFGAATNLQPRELSMVIRVGAAGTYECTVTGSVSTHVSLPITEALLADIVAETRRALMSVISQRDATGQLVFQLPVAIDADSNAVALRTLARAGASMFRRIFFGPDSRQDVRALGARLAERAGRDGEQLKLQIVAERFPIPWGLLYFGDVADDAPLDWSRFLGMRHIVEQIPLQTDLLVDDPSIRSDPSLTVGVNVNAGIDQQMKSDFVARQLAFWDRIAKGLGARLQLGKRSSRADVLAALRGQCNDQLLYLYCHAVTSNPGDPGGINASHLVLTNDEELSLDDLNRNAPMQDKLRGAPLVFINACESAELTPAFYDGFVPYFMAKGARGVIGTECKTPALFATQWALAFFPRFLAGEPLGALFLALRQEFLNQHNNPLGLLYAVYCDGDTQVQPALSL